MKEKYQLFNGNNIDKLRELEDNSVDAVVTDPPYGLSFMGKKWDYDVPSVELWAECLRVLKPGGHLLAFAGTRTQHRMAVRIEDAGFEIRDMIAWVYGSGFPKSHDVSKAIDKMDATDAAKQWQGWGTALKPALEPITVARKPLIGTVAENVLRYGTGAINVDGTRVEFVSDADRKESTAKNQHADFGTAPITNNIVYGDYSMMKPKNYNPPGRWPANFIHDGSEEVVGLFPQSKSTGGTNPSNPNVIYGKRDSLTYFNYGDLGSAARFFYCAKASKADRDAGCEHTERKPTASSEFRPNHTEKAAAGEDGNPYGRWTPRHNNHPTVKPIDLMRYLCKLITPPGGIVLDPFMGSGSTGCAALLDGFKFIGMELDDAYFKIAEARITHFNPSDFW